MTRVGFRVIAALASLVLLCGSELEGALAFGEVDADDGGFAVTAPGSFCEMRGVGDFAQVLGDACGEGDCEGEIGASERG